mgnify:CR=1 FL=1
MNLATLEDLYGMEQRILRSIEKLLENTNQQVVRTEEWVKADKAQELLSCTENTLTSFALNDHIIRQKKMGRWYYSVKSINDYLNNPER